MAAPPMNGRATTARSAEVNHYLLETAKIIEEWIRKGEDAQCPVTPFTSTQELRSNVRLVLSDQGISDKELFQTMKKVLGNSVNPWTGRFVDKLYTAPLPMGIASEALLAAINANAHVISAAPMLCLAEEACVAGLATLCGWDADLADGMTMPGGSTSNTFAIQTALNSLMPMFKKGGLLSVTNHLIEQGRSPKAARPLIFTGAEGHYSLEKAAIACGMGLESVVKVPCDENGVMDVDALDTMLAKAFADTQGTGDVVGLPLFVNATAGSTVTGSFDALDRMADVCEKYRTQDHPLWLHVDGSWGGPVLFSSRYRIRMRGVERFDSLTINPHKLLNIPHQCSFALFRNGDTLSHNALEAPYLFHASDVSSDTSAATQSDERAAALKRKLQRREGPAMMNFGCGRRGDALKFYLAWLSKGSDHFGTQVDRGIEAAQEIVQRIKTDQALCERLEVSRMGDQFLQVCFRPSLKDKRREASVQEKSKATQYVHTTLRQRRRFAVDFAPLGKGQGDFIRMVTHPSSSMHDLLDLVHEIADIGDTFRSDVS